MNRNRRKEEEESFFVEDFYFVGTIEIIRRGLWGEEQDCLCLATFLMGQREELMRKRPFEDGRYFW